MIKEKDFINNIYEDKYVRFYRGNNHIIKLPFSSKFLVMGFNGKSNNLNEINKQYSKFVSKLY
jgi:hypothetical protein